MSVCAQDGSQSGSDSDSAWKVHVQCYDGLSPIPQNILKVELDRDATVGQLKNKLRLELVAAKKCANESLCPAWFLNRVLVIGERRWSFADDYARFMATGDVRKAICVNKNKEMSLQCTIIQCSE